MLKTLTLQRFKSVYERTELAIGPLTIFAGVNNSGKSTVIQSILLAVQTLQMPVQERPISLNGHILRLGTFDDIVSSGHESEPILMGFGMSGFEDYENRPRLGQRRSLPSHARRRALGNIVSFTCEFEFSAKGRNQQREILQIQPNLNSCKLEVRFKADNRASVEGLEIRRREKDVRAVANDLHLNELTEQDLRALEYEVISGRPVPPPPYSYLSSGEIVGAALFHFIPRSLQIAFDGVDENARQIVKAFQAASEPWDEEVNPDDLTQLPESFRQILMSACESIAEKAISESANPIPKMRMKARLQDLREKFAPETYLKLLSALGPAERTVVYQLIAEKEAQLVKLARLDRPPEYRTRFQSIASPLDVATEFVSDFFQHGVKYLAPLRDEPKPVYPLSVSRDPTDVGFKGEHTAAVLELNRYRQVEYISSAQLSTYSARDHATWATLDTAVLDWLKYMGVVSDVSTTDRGKLGHELKVATEGTADLRDLTHVGVGVSQVLPIVVCALLAERGSTLIFEQPELHLHPRVQSRLADFFLSMILIGKQCIVETHSEHLINKLRQHVASSPDPLMAGKISMYFVEAIEGKSSYRPVEITPAGNIRNWPKGFFDEGEELAAEILKAAMAKRGTVSPTND